MWSINPIAFILPWGNVLQNLYATVLLGQSLFGLARWALANPGSNWSSGRTRISPLIEDLFVCLRIMSKATFKSSLIIWQTSDFALLQIFQYFETFGAYRCAIYNALEIIFIARTVPCWQPNCLLLPLRRDEEQISTKAAFDWSWPMPCSQTCINVLDLISKNVQF